jgi:hypothetical protein
VGRVGKEKGIFPKIKTAGKETGYYERSEFEREIQQRIAFRKGGFLWSWRI